MARILILGGGFGGVTVATNLRNATGEAHDIIVVDQKEHFLMGLRKPWAIAGVGSLEDGKRSRHLLTARGVRFCQERITQIDAEAGEVRTEAQTLAFDYLVVALGAEPRPDLVPGLAEHAHNLYAAASIPALKQAIEDLDSGRIVIAIAGVPYKCPPAPYETAMLLDHHLKDRGVRSAIEIHVQTLQPMLLPNAGAEGSAWLAEQLANGLGLPKAGVMAELQGERVAATIAAELEGGRAPAAFDGKGYCFVEMGKTSAARIEGDFFATPQPLVELSEPSSANAEAKREFEAERLKKWFGS